jgi:hypothetical protein
VKGVSYLGVLIQISRVVISYEGSKSEVVYIGLQTNTIIVDLFLVWMPLEYRTLHRTELTNTLRYLLPAIYFKLFIVICVVTMS